MSRVAVESLGCKLNQAETQSMALQFLDRGYQLAQSAREADIYVLNTCTVTHVADRKTRQSLRSARRANPDALIIAIGCYVERAPEELSQWGIVDLALGNKEKDRVVETIEATDKLKNKKAEKPKGCSQSRTRSLIKIQEGCDSFCSFCIVPYTRGREQSRPPEEVLHEIEKRMAVGYREVVLTGSKIGAYRWNGEGPSSLPCLVRQIMERTGVERLRLSSVQPDDLAPELLKLWADDRLCPHLHMPLQSGCQAVLQRMNRPYSIAEYERVVSLARGAISDLAITTDIVVGFPGESEREFEESYGFCQRMGFANIHVFPYSARVGTAAATMPHQVGEKVKKDRSRRMLALARQSQQRFRERFLGRYTTVLWESRLDETAWSGLTPNYLRVYTRSDHDLTNRLLKTRLLSSSEPGLLGEICEGG